MKDKLAEALLAKVLRWDTEQVAQQRSLLQALASYKYDGYQQFSPGMRFIENLAVWLQQFETISERRTAYEFVMSRLIFISNSEMNHFVSIAYPDYIRPLLMSRAARVIGSKAWCVGAIAKSTVFKSIERRTLFLGLSDGARTDVFRRANGSLSHEQIRLTHELSANRVVTLKDELKKDLSKMFGPENAQGNSSFDTVVLLDDFSASGISYLRNEDGEPKGKITKFLEQLDVPQIAAIFSMPLKIFIMLYVATTKARKYLEEQLKGFASQNVDLSLVVVQEIPDAAQVRKGELPDLDRILETYYDHDSETASTKKGGTDLRYGFAACGLALVLGHNTPNNSLGILWARGNKMLPLFPRVTRF